MRNAATLMGRVPQIWQFDNEEPAHRDLRPENVMRLEGKH
jgi:hypothetical protein